MPATIGWSKREEDGAIVVWDLPDGPKSVPVLSAGLAPGLVAVEEKWGDLCREIAEPLGVPDGYAQAHVWRESNGNPNAYRVEKDKDGNVIYVNGRILTGVGLGQITNRALKGQLTDEQLLDPRTNLTVTIKYLAFLGGKYGWDFPKVSAAYNAGSVRDSSKNRWGMVMTTGHVDAEVAAYNTWLHLKATDVQKAAAQALAHQFSYFDLLPMRGVADTLPDPEEQNS